MGSETLDLAGNEVTGDDTAGLTVDDHELQHLMTGIGFDCTLCDLTVQGSVGSKEELLSGLTSGVECTAYLSTAEGAVVEQSAVIACKRNSLSHALVDNQIAYLCKPVDIGLTAAVVASLDGVVEETVHRVVVILIVLGCVDTSLSRNRVRTAGRVADAENLDIITEFSESGSC